MGATIRPLHRAAVRTLEEVVQRGSRRDHTVRVGDGVEDLEGLVETVVQLEDGGDVAAPVAVVGSRPHSDQVLVREHELVSLLHKLMGTADEVELVDVHELVRHLVAEEPASTTRADLEGLNVVGIRPHQVAEGSLVGDLLVPGDDTDLVESLHVGGEASVDAEDLAVDKLELMSVLDGGPAWQEKLTAARVR